MTSYPSKEELKKRFWHEENSVNKYKHNTKHQRGEYRKPKKEVVTEYTKKLYRVWSMEYEYYSKEVLDYLLGRVPKRRKNG